MFAAAHLRYKPHTAYATKLQHNNNEKKTSQRCATDVFHGGNSRTRPASVLALLPSAAGGSAAEVARLVASTGLGVALSNRRCSGVFGSDGDVTLAGARRRAGSMPVIKFTLAVAWNLRNDHVRALKVTWRRLCDTPRSNCRGIIVIMERVFEKFENKEKTLKDVFYRSAFVDSMTDCAEHSRMLRSRRPPLQAAVAYKAVVEPTSDASLAENCRRDAERSICAAAESMNSIATLRDHIHFFVSLISQIIQSLQKSPQGIFEHIDRIGCYHLYLRKYGFRASMWDKLGVCLIDGLVVQDCVRGFPEACRAWTIMVAALIDRLRSAPRHMPSAASSAVAAAAAVVFESPKHNRTGVYRRPEHKLEKIVLEPSSPDICRRSNARRKSRTSSLTMSTLTLRSSRASLVPESPATVTLTERRPRTLELIDSDFDLASALKMPENSHRASSVTAFLSSELKRRNHTLTPRSSSTTATTISAPNAMTNTLSDTLTAHDVQTSFSAPIPMRPTDLPSNTLHTSVWSYSNDLTDSLPPTQCNEARSKSQIDFSAHDTFRRVNSENQNDYNS